MFVYHCKDKLMVLIKEQQIASQTYVIFKGTRPTALHNQNFKNAKHTVYATTINAVRIEMPTTFKHPLNNYNHLNL